MCSEKSSAALTPAGRLGDDHFDVRAELGRQWPVIHTGPGGSMFGYTVALHRDGSTDW